jgi:hypothetical protein
MLSVEDWAVVSMRRFCCVGIIASKKAFAKPSVGFPARKASPVADSVVTDLAYDAAGSAVAALAYDDRVRHGDAASLGVGTGSTDSVCGDAGSLGAGALGKDNAGDPTQDALPPLLVWQVSCCIRWDCRILGYATCFQ